MSFKPVIPSDVLSLLYEAGCISRRAFVTMPYEYTRISGVLKSLHEDELIIRAGKRNEWRYRLSAKGGARLMAANPSRYGAVVTNGANLFYKQPDRAVARGDVLMLMSLAGYSIHPHDKPGLPYLPIAPTRQTPDQQAAIYNNKETLCYRSADIRDSAEYIRRSTPVNCYYDGLEIKRMAMGGQSKEMAPYKNSRMSGVAFTPDYRIRILYSPGQSMDYKRAGDTNLYAAVNDMVSGYSSLHKNAVLVVGDNKFVTATRLLENSRIQCQEKDKSKHSVANRLLSATSVKDTLFFAPLLEQVVPLLRIMQYPRWRADLHEFAAQMVFDDYEMFERGGFHCRGDGILCYIAVDMNLSGLYQLLVDLRAVQASELWLLCMDWQEDFFKEALKRFYPAPYPRVRVQPLPERFLDDVENTLEQEWGSA